MAVRRAVTPIRIPGYSPVTGSGSIGGACAVRASSIFRDSFSAMAMMIGPGSTRIEKVPEPASPNDEITGPTTPATTGATWNRLDDPDTGAAAYTIDALSPDGSAAEG